MEQLLTRRNALLAGGVGVVALAGGTPWLISQAQAEPNGVWVQPPTQTKIEPSPTPSPTPAAFDLAKIDASKLVTVTSQAWFSWSLMDRLSGAIIGSTNFNETNRACSMIKTWIAADYLGQIKSPSNSRLNDITRMIRDSDSLTADDLMDELGRLQSFTRMKTVCGTTDFSPGTSWSKAVISARDTCKLAHTIAAGKVANPKWTEWLLDLMRNVRRGTWGIRPAFPEPAQEAIAIKNGWDDTAKVGEYYANCLAVAPRWSMSVLTRYPVKLGANESLGATTAQQIATQILSTPALTPLFT